MAYAASVPFRGDSSAALHLAQAALTALGFQIIEHSATVLEMLGPGMQNNRSSGLLGASKIRISSTRGELAIEAELGAAARLSRFVCLFPICLPLAIGLVFSAVFGAQLGPGPWIDIVAAAVGINVLVWMVAGPLIARSIMRKTTSALDTLLANMKAVGEPHARVVV